ncbi:MAG TPA: GTPase HflX, partial [Armatimonadota bacterium]|nr:GTPase HflX [Armatimonadota bacterium]
MAHARMHEVEPVPMPRENVVVAALENPEADWEESLAEMERLVDTANGRVVAVVTQRRDKPEPATYLGKGKVEETKALIQEHGAQLLVIDGELSPSQQRN